MELDFFIPKKVSSSVVKVEREKNGKEEKIETLIIGGMDYLGKILATRLIQNDYNVRIYDNRTNAHLDKFDQNIQVKVTYGNLNDYEQLNKACCGIKRVFLLNTPSFCTPYIPFTTTKNEYNSEDEISISNVHTVIDACIQQNVQELIYCSCANVVYNKSGALYMDENLPCISENNCRDKYFLNKRKVEEIILNTNKNKNNKNIKTIALRPYMIYGHNLYGKYGVIDHMLEEIKEGKSKIIVGNGDVLTDLTYIENAVHALILAGEILGEEKKVIIIDENGAKRGRDEEEKISVAGKVYNITNDEPLRYWCFFSNICGELGFQRPYIYIPFWIMFTFAHIFEIFFGNISPIFYSVDKLRIYGNNNLYVCTRAKKELGYAPAVLYEEGFKQVIEHIKANDKDVQLKLYNLTGAEIGGEGGSKLMGGGGRKGLSKVALNLPRAVNESVVETLSLKIITCISCILSCMFLFKTICLLLNIANIQAMNLFSYKNSFLATVNLYTSNAILSFVCFLSFFILSISVNIYNTRCTIPRYSNNTYIINDFMDFSSGPLSFCFKMAKQCRGLFSVSFFGKPIIYLGGKDSWEFFFKCTDKEVSMKEVYNVTRPVFGDGLIYDADLDHRQQQFHFLAQGLSEKKLTEYVPLILKECQEYFNNKWEGKNEGICDNVITLISELTCLSACRCLLGKEIRENFYAEVSQLLHDLDGGITYIATILPDLPIPAHKKRDRARAELSKIYSKVIAGRKKAALNKEGKNSNSLNKENNNNNNSKNNNIDTDQKSNNDLNKNDELDMVGILMNAEYKDGKKLTDDEICGLLVCLIFAGQHTSSITIGWLLINILLHPEEALKNLLDEIDSIKSNICYDTVANKTEKLLSCFIESLRLHPPLGNLMRYIVKPLLYKGHILPVGSVIACCTYETGYNEDVFFKCTEFIPSRWENTDWDKWRQMYKYVLFGAGRHTCMGKRFAILQAKTVILYLFSNFIITPLSPKPRINQKGMVIEPLDKFTVKFKRIPNNMSVKQAYAY